MTSIWKHHNIQIKPGRPWTASDGTQHSGNWNFWSADEKKKWNIKEIVQESSPDTRLYTFNYDENGKVENKKAMAMDDSGSGETKVLGVKSKLKHEVKSQQAGILKSTDWYIIRKADVDKAVPSNVKTFRDAVRTKAKAMEDAIDACSKVEDIAKLWVEYDKDGKKSGVLYDWPELGS
tara:strand:+ start:1083 stop:1616 length:534 start_codon:yes stop_codon:yes gene_type:complete